MINLVDAELYHIHVLKDKSNVPNKYSDRWVIGNVLQFGSENSNETNLLSERALNPFINLEWEKTLIKQLVLKKKNSNTITGKNGIQTEFYQKGLMFKYFQFASEIILEEVRKAFYPEKPSRLNGIWLTDKENLKTWLGLFPKNQFQQKIFLVKFTGKVHKADGRWINCNTFSFDILYKNAVSYWKGEPKTKKAKPNEEFIGCGSLVILEEICKFKDLNSITKHAVNNQD